MAPDKRIPLLFIKDCGYVPAVLVNAGELIEKHIKTENLFQVQGSTVKVKQLMSILSLQKMPKLPKLHVHDVVEVIKVCLCHLSTELIPTDIMNLLIEANQSQMSDYTSILNLFCRTSPVTFAAVHYVMRLLNKINLNSASNGMDARRLATIFVLDILKPLTAKCQDDPQEYEAFRLQRVEKLPYLIMVIEQLILGVSSFKHASLGTNLNRQMSKMMLKTKTVSSVENLHNAKSKDLTIGDDTKDLQDELEDHGNPVQCDVDESMPGQLADGTRPVEDAERVDAKLDTGRVPVKSLDNHDKLATGPKNSALGRAPPRTNNNKSGQLMKTRRPSSEISSAKESQAKNGEAASKTKKGIPVSHLKSNLAKRSSPVKPKSNFRLKRSLLHSVHVKGESNSNKVKSPKRNIFHRKNRKVKRPGNPKDLATKKGSSFCFQQDEELAPWGNPPTDSDDSSVMKRSIRQPRFRKSRAVSPSDNVSNGRLSKPDDSTVDRTYFLTISSPYVPLSRILPYFEKPKDKKNVCRASSPKVPRAPGEESRKSPNITNNTPEPNIVSHLSAALGKYRMPKANYESGTQTAKVSTRVPSAEGTLPKRKQLFEKHYKHAQMLNSRRFPRHPVKWRAPVWVADTVLLGVALSCFYVIIIVLRTDNEEYMASLLKRLKTTVMTYVSKFEH